MISNSQKEELRHAAREVLATRPGTALDIRGIRRRIEQGKLLDFGFDDVDLRAALAVLAGKDQITIVHDGLGSTEHFIATAEGILAFERGH